MLLLRRPRRYRLLVTCASVGLLSALSISGFENAFLRLRIFQDMTFPTVGARPLGACHRTHQEAVRRVQHFSNAQELKLVGGTLPRHSCFQLSRGACGRVSRFRHRRCPRPRQQWQSHHRVQLLANDDALEAAPLSSRFEFETAVLLAGFAFETYNTPDEDNVRWERGEDGIDVCLLSDEFVPNVYKGLLTATLIGVEDLREETGGVSEALITGSRSDPYVLLNVMEDGQSLLSKSVIATGSINDGRVKTSVHVSRSSTLWRGGGSGKAEWEGEGNGEVLRLYVKDLAKARLGIRVMDENIAFEDQLLGASELDLQPIVSNGSWSGKVPLVFKSKDWDWGAGAAGLAASAFTGIATGGASLAVGAAAMVFKAVSPADQAGSLELQLRYQQLESEQEYADASKGTAYQAPVGASPGVDWTELSRAAGGVALEASNHDFLGFVSNTHTSTEAGLWRDVAKKRIIIAFKGTEMTDIKDLITDVSILKTPWEARDKNDPSPEDTEPFVHAGFRKALDSVAQRLKTFILQAVGGLPQEWEVLITGHSLGGALATLMALDLAQGLDASKGLPVAPKQRPWIARLFGGEEFEPPPPNPKFKRLALYTFGAPRVGNAAFASALDAAVPEAYRVVNSQDVVARFPRGFYMHGGRTALLSNTSSKGTFETTDGLWVEGEASGRCPLRDDAVLSNPLAKESLLGDLYSRFEQGPLAELSLAANQAAAAAEDLRAQLVLADSAAKGELSELADDAAASVAELRLAGERAATLGDKLQAAYRAGASEEELLALEDEAANAVASDLARAVKRSNSIGNTSQRLSGAVAGVMRGDSKAADSSSSVKQAVAVLSKAETAAASAATSVSKAFERAREELTTRLSTATVGEFASIIGLDASYANSEVQLLSAIGTGRAIIEHMEPSYYQSMWSVVHARSTNKSVP